MRLPFILTALSMIILRLRMPNGNIRRLPVENVCNIEGMILQEAPNASAVLLNNALVDVPALAKKEFRDGDTITIIGSRDFTRSTVPPRFGFSKNPKWHRRRNAVFSTFDLRIPEKRAVQIRSATSLSLIRLLYSESSNKQTNTIVILLGQEDSTCSYVDAVVRHNISSPTIAFKDRWMDAVLHLCGATGLQVLGFGLLHCLDPPVLRTPELFLALHLQHLASQSSVFSKSPIVVFGCRNGDEVQLEVIHYFVVIRLVVDELVECRLTD